MTGDRRANPLPPRRIQSLRTWNNHLAARCEVYRPERLSELQAIVACPQLRDVICRGLGRSYSDCHLNEAGCVILQERLDRMLSFDFSSGILECEGGVALDDIIDCFLPRGFFPPVTPGTKFVTIGGAIANDVHGKNHHRDGSLGAHILSLSLLTAGGETLQCSPQMNPDLFWATVGGLGLTGIITSARIRLQHVNSGYMKVDIDRAPNLDAALERFSETDERYQYSMAWIDALAGGGSLGRSVLIRGNHAEIEELPAAKRRAPLAVRRRRRPSLPFFLPSFALNAASVRAFNEAYYVSHPDRTGSIVPYDSFFYPLDAIGNWYRLYGRRGFVQFQAVFPPEVSRRALIELLQEVSRSRRASFLAVLKAMGPAGEGLLSFPMAGHTLALDMANTGRDLAVFMCRLNELALAHGGRVYLAKDAFLTAEAAASMYPRLQRFRRIKMRLDPKGRFASSLARRIGLVESKEA